MAAGPLEKQGIHPAGACPGHDGNGRLPKKSFYILAICAIISKAVGF
jgi:hypothetical protein